MDASPTSAFQFSVVIDNLRSRASVITDLARYTIATRQALLELLHTHIRGHVVQLRKHLYLQREGVPQGSVVSPLLTAATYARLEHELLPPEINRHTNRSDFIFALLAWLFRSFRYE